jgi:hypothetical protein
MASFVALIAVALLGQNSFRNGEDEKGLPQMLLPNDDCGNTVDRRKRTI